MAFAGLTGFNGPGLLVDWAWPTGPRRSSPAAWQTAFVERLVQPPASEWAFPCSAGAQEAVAGTGEVVGIGADLEPGTLLAAYRCGLFPMPVAKSWPGGRLTRGESSLSMG